MRRPILPHSPWRPGKARNGKIARLPEPLRETINLLLLDGLTYEAIIAKLGDAGKHLTYHNLKRWRQGGYQDWLLARQSADRTRIREQVLQKLVSQSNPKDLPSKLAAAVASQYMQFFLDFDATSLRENLQSDAGSFISLLNSVAKTAHHGLDCAKARRKETSLRASLAAAKDPQPAPGPISTNLDR